MLKDIIEKMESDIITDMQVSNDSCYRACHDKSTKDIQHYFLPDLKKEAELQEEMIKNNIKIIKRQCNWCNEFSCAGCIGLRNKNIIEK